MRSFFNRRTSVDGRSKPESNNVYSDIQRASSKIERRLGSPQNEHPPIVPDEPRLSSAQNRPAPPRRRSTREVAASVPLPRDTANDPSYTQPPDRPKPPPIPDDLPNERPAPTRKSTDGRRPPTASRKSTDVARNSRQSAEIPRDGKPRRSGSMRRAYNFLLGREERPENANGNTEERNGAAGSLKTAPGGYPIQSQPAAPQLTTLERNTPASPITEDAQAEDDVFHESNTRPTTAAEGTSKTNDSAYAKLKEDLTWYKKELQEAGDIIQAQNENMEKSQQDSKALHAEYERKELALQQQKKAIEDHMVAVVVQQVKEAREQERAAVMAECQQDYSVKLEKIRSANLNESKVVFRDLENARQDLAARQRRITELEQSAASQADGHTQRIRELEKGLKARQAAHDEVSRQRSDLHVQLQDALARLSSVEATAAQHESVNARNEDLSRQYQDLEKERASLVAEVAELRTDRESTSNQQAAHLESSKAALAAAEATNEKLKLEMAELKADLSKQLEFLGAEHTTNAQLKEQLADLQQQLQSATGSTAAQIEAYESHKAAAEKALENALATSTLRSSELASLKAMLTEKDAELEAAVSTKASLEQQSAEQQGLHESTIAALKAQIEEQSTKHEDLLSASEAKAVETATIAAERDSHAQAHEAAKAQIGELESRNLNMSAVAAERDSHIEAHEGTKKQLAELTSERDIHAKAHESTKASLAELTAALATAQAGLAELKTSKEAKDLELQDQAVRQTTLESELAEVRSLLAEKETQLEQTLASSADTFAQIKELEALKVSHAEATSTVDARSKELEDVRNELQQAQQKAVTHERGVEDANAEHQTTKDKLAALEADLASAKANAERSSELEKELESHKTDYATLTDKHTAVEQQLQEAIARESTQQQDQAAKQEELSHRIASLENELESLKTMATRATELETELATLKQTHEDELKALRASDEEAQTALVAARGEAEKHQQDLANAQDAHVAVLKERETAFDDLNTKHAEIVAALTVAQNELTAEKEAHAKAVEDLKVSKNECENLKPLQVRVASLDEELRSSKSSYNEANASLKDLEQQYATTRNDLKAKIIELENSQEHATQLKQALTDSKEAHTALQAKYETLDKEHTASWEQVGAETEKMKQRESELVKENDELKAAAEEAKERQAAFDRVNAILDNAQSSSSSSGPMSKGLVGAGIGALGVGAAAATTATGLDEAKEDNVQSSAMRNISKIFEDASPADPAVSAGDRADLANDTAEPTNLSDSTPDVSNGLRKSNGDVDAEDVLPLTAPIEPTAASGKENVKPATIGVRDVDDEIAALPETGKVDSKEDDIATVLAQGSTTGKTHEEGGSKPHSLLAQVQEAASETVATTIDTVKKAAGLEVSGDDDVAHENATAEEADAADNIDLADPAASGQPSGRDVPSPRPSPKKRVSFKDEIPGESISQEHLTAPLEEDAEAEAILDDKNTASTEPPVGESTTQGHAHPAKVEVEEFGTTASTPATSTVVASGTIDGMETDAAPVSSPVEDTLKTSDAKVKGDDLVVTDDPLPSVDAVGDDNRSTAAEATSAMSLVEPSAVAEKVSPKVTDEKTETSTPVNKVDVDVAQDDVESSKGAEETTVVDSDSVAERVAKSTSEATKEDVSARPDQDATKDTAHDHNDKHDETESPSKDTNDTAFATSTTVDSIAKDELDTDVADVKDSDAQDDAVADDEWPEDEPKANGSGSNTPSRSGSKKSKKKGKGKEK